jgi:hypothetical protein
MLGMSLPPDVCRGPHVLFTLFVFACVYSGVQHILCLCFCFVFLRRIPYVASFFCFVQFWFPFRYSLTFLHYQSVGYFRMQFMFMHFYRRGYTSIVFMVFKLVNTWQPSHVLQKLIHFFVCSFVFTPIKNTILIQKHVNSKHNMIFTSIFLRWCWTYFVNL